MNIMQILQQKFESGNEVAVTRNSISLQEYKMLVEYVEQLEKQIALYEEKFNYGE